MGGEKTARGAVETARAWAVDEARAAPHERRFALVVVGLAAATVVALNGLFIARPGLVAFELELSGALLAAALAGAALGASFFFDRRVAVICLVALVFLNLSEVLVRFHGMPSLLQFLFLPLAFAAIAWTEPRRARARLANPVTVLLVGYTLLLISSSTWAHDAQLADEAWLDNLKATGIYVLLVALLTSVALLRLAAWTVVLSASVPAALGTYQVIAGDFASEFGGLARIKDAQIYADVFEPRIAGPLGDPNFFAQILLLALPLGVMLAKNTRSPAKRLLAWGASSLIVAATVLTYSRGAALAFVLVALLLLLALDVDRRALAAGAIGLALLGAAFLPADFTRRLATIEQLLPGSTEVLEPDSSFAKRRLVTTVAWMMFVDHPAVGVGAGNYAAHFDDYADEMDSASRQYQDPGEDVRQYAHNLALEIGAETGVAGLVLFAAIVAACCVALLQGRALLRAAGDHATADLATALLIGLAAYMTCGLFLHLAFPRQLWMAFGFAAALQWTARECAAAAAGHGVLPGAAAGEGAVP